MSQQSELQVVAKELSEECKNTVPDAYDQPEKIKNPKNEGVKHKLGERKG